MVSQQYRAMTLLRYLAEYAQRLWTMVNRLHPVITSQHELANPHSQGLFQPHPMISQDGLVQENRI
jgi:hypothetical protein